MENETLVAQENDAGTKQLNLGKDSWPKSHALLETLVKSTRQGASCFSADMLSLVSMLKTDII